MRPIDLDNGMMVELRNGEKGIVINDGIYIKHSDDKYSLTLDYNDDFTHVLMYNKTREEAKELDIICVYKTKSKNYIYDFLYCEGAFKEIWYEDDFNWNEVKKDSLLIIKRDSDETPFMRYFSKVEDNIIYTYPKGATSITFEGNLETYYKDEVQLGRIN